MYRLFSLIIGCLVLHSVAWALLPHDTPHTIVLDAFGHVTDSTAIDTSSAFGSRSIKLNDSTVQKTGTRLRRDSIALSSRNTLRRENTTQGILDTLRNTMNDSDSLSVVRVDTAARIHPLRSVGSLTPTSAPYPGPSAEVIRWNEYRTMTDLFSGIQGIFVRDMGSPGQDNQVTINGAGHTGTAFLVDGIAQNDPVSGTYNFAYFPVEAIERIEIVTGPRSFLYGPNAVGGSINAITHNFSNNKPYTHIRYSQAPFSSTQTDAMFSQNIFARFNLSFGLSYLGYGSAITNVGRFPNADNEAYSFRTKLRYNFSPTLNFVFTHFYYSTHTSVNGGINIAQTLLSGSDVYDENAASVINRESFQKLFNHHAAFSGIYHPRADSSLRATLTFEWAQHRSEYRDEENRGFPTNGIVMRYDIASTILGTRGQIEYDVFGNRLSAILETRTTRFGNSIYLPDTMLTASSLSVKDELPIGEDATVAAFGKVERFAGSTLIDVGADASLHITQGITLTAGMSLAHRQPAPDETAFAGGGADSVAQTILLASGITSGTPNALILAEELHHVFELSLQCTPIDNVQAAITATRRRVERWIDRTLIVPRQINDLTVDCLSASMRLRHGNFFLEGSTTYTTTLRGATQIWLYPQWRGQGSLYFRGLLAKGNLDLQAGIRGKFYSTFDGEQINTARAVLVASAGATISDRQIGNAGTVDIIVVAHIGDAYIHVLWENLTNSAYMLTPFYPMYDRAIRFGVSWEFLD